MPKIKFSFVPERQLNKIGEVTNHYNVSIYSNGQLVFNADTLKIYELENKFIKLFADIEKKTLGWAVIDGKTEMGDLNESYQLSPNVNGQATVGITRILKRMGLEKGAKFSKLPVKVYKSALSPDIYYVELEKEVKLEND